MSGRPPYWIGAALLALALATGASGARASCAAPTPATACPQCAVAVVGAFHIGDGSAPTVVVERVIRQRPGLPALSGRLPVVLPQAFTDPTGVRHYMECAFVPEDGQRMLYLLDPAPEAPGRYRIVWGFTPDASGTPVAEHRLP